MNHICDVILFNGEMDLLRARLAEHSSFVERFYIVEASRTFSYNQKPLYYLNHSSEYAEWSDKIRHAVIGILCKVCVPESANAIAGLITADTISAFQHRTTTTTSNAVLDSHSNLAALGRTETSR